MIRNQLRRAPQASAASVLRLLERRGRGPDVDAVQRAPGCRAPAPRSPTASAGPGSAPRPPLWPGTWKRPGRAPRRRAAHRDRASPLCGMRERCPDATRGRGRPRPQATTPPRSRSAVELPGAEPDHALAGLQRERDLGQGAEPAADRDERVGGAHDQRVAGLAQAGGDRHVDVVVGGGAVEPGQDPERGRRRLAWRRGRRPPSRLPARRRRPPPRARRAARPTASASAQLGGGRVAGPDDGHVAGAHRSEASCAIVRSARTRSVRSRTKPANRTGARACG